MPPPVEQFETYEQQLKSSHRWAMSEASQFFEGQGAVQRALQAITSKLTELEIPYAVVGGTRRSTVSVTFHPSSGPSTSAM
jgi:hypothetical protein